MALTSSGQRVTLVDEDRGIISRVAKGNLPFYDPDAETEISKAMCRRKMSLSDSIRKSVRDSGYIFMASDIPLSRSGSVNLSKIEKDVEKVGSCLRHGSTVVILSRVTPGTTEGIISQTIERSSGLKHFRDFNLAVCKLMPEKIVLGVARKRIGEDVASLFDAAKSNRVVVQIRAAEALEFLDGCARATKISCSNEIANLCEILGIDAREVLPEIGLDANMVGLGYGDPEMIADVASIIHIGKRGNARLDVLRAAQKVNRRQALRAIRLLKEELGSLKGKRIALLGLATDNGTTAIDGSRAFEIAVGLLADGAKVVGYDRLAMSEFIKALPEISYASSVREALLDADGCVIHTADPEFARLTRQDFDLMRNKTVIDGRRILSAAKMDKYGVSYRAIGLGTEKKGA